MKWTYSFLEGYPYPHRFTAESYKKEDVQKVDGWVRQTFTSVIVIGMSGYGFSTEEEAVLFRIGAQS